jgi:hypothetical protein
MSLSMVLSAWFEVTSMTFSIVFDDHAFFIPTLLEEEETTSKQ